MLLKRPFYQINKQAPFVGLKRQIAHINSPPPAPLRRNEPYFAVLKLLANEAGHFNHLYDPFTLSPITAPSPCPVD